MIKAQLQGRRLSLTVETDPDETAIAPFLVSPLSAKDGRELSTRYVFVTEGIPVSDGDGIEGDLVLALGAENFRRADEELSAAEGELIAQAAYLWQTLGGLEAVLALLAVDEHGRQGTPEHLGKALAVFRLRMVPLLSQIRHRLESARRTSGASTPGTDTRSGGESSGSEPGEKPSSDSPTDPPTTDTSPLNSPGATG